MSTSTLPLKAPFSAICIARLTIVASTRPSTTSVSQSSISTPFSLMLGPTMSLLPPGSSACAAPDSAGTAWGTGRGAAGGEAAAGACDKAAPPVGKVRGSRRAKRFSPYFILASLGGTSLQAALTIRARGRLEGHFPSGRRASAARDDVAVGAQKRRRTATSCAGIGRKHMIRWRSACRPQPTSDHFEWLFAARRGKRLLESGERVGVERDRGCRVIRTHMLGSGRFRNRDHPRIAQQPRERDLARLRPDALRHGAHRGVASEVAFVERRVGHDGNLARGAPRHQVVLDAAPRQVVEHLVRADALAPRDREELLQVADVEVGDAPAPDLSRAHQLLQRGDGFLEQHGTAPVKQVQIERVDPQLRQRPVARRDELAPRGVVGIELAHDEDRIAPAADRLAHHALGASLSVHLGGVDEVHAQVKAKAQRRHLRGALGCVLPHVPGAHPQARKREAQSAWASVPYCGFMRWDLALILLSALRYALAEATTMSVSEPMPFTTRPFFASRTVTSPCESVPSVT